MGNKMESSIFISVPIKGVFLSDTNCISQVFIESKVKSWLTVVWWSKVHLLIIWSCSVSLHVHQKRRCYVPLHLCTKTIFWRWSVSLHKHQKCTYNVSLHLHQKLICSGDTTCMSYSLCKTLFQEHYTCIYK